ncbi:hypothetical protein MTO96_051483 [Rhipicephalus appendiculatus]
MTTRPAVSDLCTATKFVGPNGRARDWVGHGPRWLPATKPMVAMSLLYAATQFVAPSDGYRVRVGPRLLLEDGRTGYVSSVRSDSARGAERQPPSPGGTPLAPSLEEVRIGYVFCTR